MLRFISCVMVFCVFCAPAAWAQASPEQVQSLKNAFDAYMDFQKQSNEAFGDVVVEYIGAVEAKPGPEYVTLTLPQILLKGQKPDAASVLDMGIISMNAAPSGQAGVWNVAMTIPAQITMKDQTDSVLAILIGGQSITGVFDEKLGYFQKLNFALRDLTVQESGQDLGIKIAGLETVYDLTQGSDGLFSGPASFGLSGLTVGDENFALKLGGVSSAMNFDGLKLLSMQEYAALFQKHKAGFEALKLTAEPESTLTPEQTNAMMSMVFEVYAPTFRGMDMRLSLTDLALDTLGDTEEGEPTQKAPAEAEHLSLKSADFKVHLGGMDGESSSFGMGASYDGLNLEPSDPQYEGVVPNRMAIGFDLEKLPIKTLSETVKATASAAISNPDMASVAGLGLLIKLPALMAQAGSQLVLKDNTLSSDLYNVTLDGLVKADLAAISSFTGKFTGVFAGLDELLRKLRENEQKDDAYTPQEYAELAGFLEELKTYGRAEPGARRSTYRYELELTADGKVLVNGKEADFTKASGESAPVTTEDHPPSPGTPATP